VGASRVPTYLEPSYRGASATAQLLHEISVELSGLHRTYIDHIERAEKAVTNVTANKVAGALGTTCRAYSRSWSGTRMIQLPDKRRVHHDYLSESY
jgi:hypothetical protein